MAGGPAGEPGARGAGGGAGRTERGRLSGAACAPGSARLRLPPRPHPPGFLRVPSEGCRGTLATFRFSAAVYLSADLCLRTPAFPCAGVRLTSGLSVSFSSSVSTCLRLSGPRNTHLRTARPCPSSLYDVFASVVEKVLLVCRCALPYALLLCSSPDVGVSTCRVPGLCVSSRLYFNFFPLILPGNLSSVGLGGHFFFFWEGGLSLCLSIDLKECHHVLRGCHTHTVRIPHLEGHRFLGFLFD